MAQLRYLSVADVIALHELVMRQLGLAPNPLRDAGGLESAVVRPQMSAWYEGTDLIRQAALLGVGISQAQAFLDGNKRTAYLALNMFLRMNGHTYAGNRLALARQLEQFADHSSDPAALDVFETWLREHVRERSGG